MTTPTFSPRWSTILTVAVAVLLTSVGVSPAFADDVADAPAVAPQLSITITDDRESTDTAEKLDYTIVIENIGATDALGLVITQSVPEGLSFGSADSGGALDAGNVSWTLDLSAASSTTVGTTMTVGETPKDLFRLATVACAHPTSTEPPIVCASDSDLLPAGALAEAASDPATTAPATTPSWWIAGVIVAVLVIGALGAVIVVRRRRRVPHTESAGPVAPRDPDNSAIS